MEASQRRNSAPASYETLAPFTQQTYECTPDGWGIYSADDEIKAMGLPDDKFRVSDVNATFEFSASYPKKLIVPADVDDETLQEVAKFRHFNRIPLLRYIHPKTRAPLFIAGQPLVGRRNRCYEDERLFRSILQASPEKAKRGRLFDLRTQDDVKDEQKRGGGSEIMDGYFNWERLNANMGRLDSLQDAFNKTKDVCQGVDMSNVLTKFESAGWLTEIWNLLRTAVVISRTLSREEMPVVIHATTGFDQEIQVSALAQLLLEPRFRTMQGFQQLIEKEWLHGGHPFSTRYGHYDTQTKWPVLESPMFTLFIDAVYQCTQQYAWEFEFNELFLLTLLTHVKASPFGTFLFNNAKLREHRNLETRTASLWGWINSESEKRRFTNPVYNPSLGSLKPCFKPQGICLWRAIFAEGAPYLAYHREVDELLVFLKDKHDTVAEETARQQDELDQLTKELERLKAAA
eukprot:m.14581 g.14581  ORF g.14581 m.14581 type:complete len:460 (-) comp5148_c0_seq1:96-1475(-)